MDGSSVAYIVIPAVAAICLAVWLIMVFYADTHPFWVQSAGRRPTPIEQQVPVPNPVRLDTDEEAAHAPALPQ